MKRMLWYTNLVVLFLLALNTGLIKLGIGPQQGVEADIRIFAELGFSLGMTVAFGIFQIAGGVALLWSRTRRIGAIALLLSFVIATTGLFVSGVYAFGVISFIFFGLAAVPILRPVAPTPLTNPDPAAV